jgi:hypothetical protein
MKAIRCAIPGKKGSFLSSGVYFTSKPARVLKTGKEKPPPISGEMKNSVSIVSVPRFLANVRYVVKPVLKNGISFPLTGMKRSAAVKGKAAAAFL